jgi:hypothetical protein
MPNEFWTRTHCYRQWVDDCVAMANATSSDCIRAELYAAAEYYLCLSKVERNLTESKSEPRDEPDS